MPDQVMICGKSKHRDCISAWGSWGGGLHRGGQEFNRQGRGSRVLQGVGRDARQRHVWGTERFRVAEIWYMIGHERKQIWGNLAATRSWILDFSLLSPTGILKHRSF